MFGELTGSIMATVLQMVVMIKDGLIFLALIIPQFGGWLICRCISDRR